MTNRRKEVIEDNLNAYIANFGYISIENEECGKGFYVYTSPERKEQGSYTQYCYNLDYLNGWLYGAVQAANKIMKKIEEVLNHESNRKGNYAKWHRNSIRRLVGT